MASFTAPLLTLSANKNRNFAPVKFSALLQVISLLVIGFMSACNPAKEEVAPQVQATITPIVMEAPAPYNARIAADAIDVRTFGAKGDGQADDTDAIRKALKSSAGKQLVFQAGTYKVSQIIKIDVSNIELVGVGAAKIQSSVRSIFSLENVSNVSFANLTFESTSRDGSTYYFGLIYSNQKTITGLTFNTCTFTAPYCSTTGIKLVTDAVSASVSKVQVTNCQFTDLGTMGIEIQNHLNDGVDRFSDVEVRSCTFRNLGLNDNAAYHYGMAVSCSGAGKNVIIANNTVINPYDIGIELAGAVKNGQILRNQFGSLTRMNKEGNRPLSLISLSSSKGGKHQNIQIIGNQNLSATDNAYVFLGNIERATVEDNTFNTVSSMQIRNVSNSTFKNNTVISRGSVAVLVESSDFTTQNNSFANCTFTCTGNSAVEAVVKFSGAKTTGNTINQSKLARFSSSSKHMVEANSATKNILNNCTLTNK